MHYWWCPVQDILRNRFIQRFNVFRAFFPRTMFCLLEAMFHLCFIGALNIDSSVSFQSTWSYLQPCNGMKCFPATFKPILWRSGTLPQVQWSHGHTSMRAFRKWRAGRFSSRKRSRLKLWWADRGSERLTCNGPENQKETYQMSWLHIYHKKKERKMEESPLLDVTVMKYTFFLK